MPVLKFKTERLENLTGLTLGEIEELLFRLKCETEESPDGEILEVEINPDRPDMYIGEGIARAILGLVGKRRGWTRPLFEYSSITLVNESPKMRPYIAAAVVYNVDVDEVYLEELIQFQEKLHDTIGRRRRKIAIGFHDLDKLPSQTIYYRQASIDDIEFVPLHHNEKMTARRVLEETDQGRAYGGISLMGDSHPFLLAGKDVIAMPPVINSDITRIEPGTRNLFIDVTGTDRVIVEKTLDIIVSGLMERPGSRIARVRVVEGTVETLTPTFKSKNLTVGLDYVNSTLGTRLTSTEAAELAERMGHNVKPTDNILHVEIPPYRVDVLGPIDIVEDIAIAIGYEELGYERPTVKDPGRLLPESVLARVLRDLAIGFGFTEVMQLTLTSPRLLDSLDYKERVEVLNPVQYEYSVLRPSLIPSLLTVMQANQHAKKPVKIFEIGSVVLPGNPPPDHLMIGLSIMDVEVGYEDIQAVVYSILRLLGIPFSVKPVSQSPLLDGRTAALYLDEKYLGIMGEVHPEVLESLGIEYPVVVAELDVGVLTEWRYKIQGHK